MRRDLYYKGGMELPGVNFNLGVCYELDARYDEALPMYMGSWGKRILAEAVNRVVTKKDKNVRK